MSAEGPSRAGWFPPLELPRKSGTANHTLDVVRRFHLVCYYNLEEEAITVFGGFKESLHHLSACKIAIERIEFVEPEIESS